MCQVRQQRDTVPRMIRPVVQLTVEQKAALVAAKKLADQHRKIEADMWAAIKAARDLGIADTRLCEETGQSRATLNRKYGPRPGQPHGE